MLKNLDPGKRLIVYVIINVIVSALTTLLVLIIWTKVTFSGAPNIVASSGGAAPAALGDLASINAVIGAGDLANERVVIQQIGDQDVSLAGWVLRDGNGNVYRFPALVLHPGAAVDVYTATGEDTATSLYWDRSVAVWSSGEQATLQDASDHQQAAYTVP